MYQYIIPNIIPNWIQMTWISVWILFKRYTVEFLCTCSRCEVFSVCFIQPYLRVRAVVVKHVHLDFLCRGGRRPGHPFLYHWFQPQERCLMFHLQCATLSFLGYSLSKHLCFRLNRYTVLGSYSDRITLPVRAVSTLTRSLTHWARACCCC